MKLVRDVKLASRGREEVGLDFSPQGLWTLGKLQYMIQTMMNTPRVSEIMTHCSVTTQLVKII